MTIPTSNQPTLAELIRNPELLLAFGFGTGLAKVAPGTFGTLVGIPFFLLLAPLPWAAYLAVVFGMFVVGVRFCQTASHILGVHDHGGIVWDEIVGYLLTMAFAPPIWYWMVVGFVLFRCFDIFKPWPIRWIDQNYQGGLGIMLDDILAGLFAGLLLWLMVWMVAAAFP